MLRLVDILLAIFLLVTLFPIMLLIYVLGWLDTKSPLFIQERVGIYQRPFKLIKFRTMKLNTESIASHLIGSEAITFHGNFLRKTKLDELPQLFNVLLGDMSLVGPRPNLFNQIDLISQRERERIYNVRPGITGLSQINNIDMSTPELLVEMDRKMLDNLSIWLYFKILYWTLLGKGSGDAANKES